MAKKATARPHLQILQGLAQETLYVGVDIGKRRHVAGFISSTLLARHARFEGCPALSFEQLREGFRSLIDRIQAYVPLEQVYVLLEPTGHYHRPLVQYLQELDIPVYLLPVQKRQAGLLKTDKRDALSLANHLYNHLEHGIQVADKMQLVRRLVPPTEAAVQLRGMVQHRYELIRESTQRKNKLIAICDEVFPELTQVFKDPNLPTALRLRERFPTPAALAVASFSAVRETRTGGRPSDVQLLELQRLATQSIGTKDPARLRGLAFEQNQLIQELRLIQQHLEQVEIEMMRIGTRSREGRILRSIPGIGELSAATLIALIGNIANFASAAALKSYCGWAPTITQSGQTLDHTRLSPRGVRLLKRTIYLCVWKALQMETEWAAIYQRLVPLKCAYDERTRQYLGRGKVIGRIAGQMVSVIYALLKQDQELLQKLLPGTKAPPPRLYDPEIHRRHRTGQYQAASRAKPHALLELPPP